VEVDMVVLEEEIEVHDVEINDSIDSVIVKSPGPFVEFRLPDI
jgi:hypothetical protein